MEELGGNQITEQEKAEEGDETAKAEELTKTEAEAEMNTESDHSDMMDDDDESQENLMEMYLDESMKHIQEGEVIAGKVVKVDKEYVLVDIGYKSEGQISINEFRDKDGQVDVKLGDTVDVLLEKWKEDEDTIYLSKEKAAKMKVWDDIKKAYESDEAVKGIVTNRVRGGFSVDIGVEAFLPGSQVDLRPIRDFDHLVGNSFDFKILKYSKKRNNIVLSRRVILEKERDKLRQKTLETITEGKVIKGVVKNITEYGVFIDLGGIDGLLHITDMSWGRVVHPSDLVAVGDEIEVKVLSLDLERERVSLGMKQLVPDPWTTADERYPVGLRVTGKVISLTDYGAFVELEKGVEGLIHVSEMSWTQKIRYPSKVVSIGDIIDVVILNIDAENRRVSLGMKQLAPNPWDVVSDKYPVGTVIEGKVKNITDFGLFIGIEEGIDGLVHISDISWTKRIKHPSELYKKSEEVRAIVLNVDKENERFSLGVKQLELDPWQTIPDRYHVGTKVSGTVTNVTDFGVFVELEKGIEGLIHVSEVSKEKVKTPVGKFNVGDALSAKVVNVSSKERRIGLSLKKLDEADTDKDFHKYLNNSKGATSTFGELLKENLKEKLNINHEALSEPSESPSPEKDIKADA
ncbi:MAG: 30S ribosomal protein S1 [Deltaproteobacteria bacterium]|nr:30S ribosomal protein S1 [Deltaproteobacteria bacterium]